MKQTCIGEHLPRRTMKKYWNLLKDWVQTHARMKQWLHYKNSVGLACVEHMQLTLEDLYGLSLGKKLITQNDSGEPTSSTAKAVTETESTKQKHTDNTYSQNQAGGTEDFPED